MLLLICAGLTARRFVLIAASENPYYLASQKRWKCRNGKCGRQFSVKVGTIFEDSPISLKKWLPAMWLHL